ncbi:glycerol ethanol, ferric requiring protein, partial [Dimargaris verticillata]
EEHLFNRPISTVMVRDPVVFTVRGMRLDQIECLLARSEIKTFPIVDSHTDRHIQGCINRAELHYAIRKAKQLHGIQENAHCYFESLGVTPVALTSSNSASSSTNPSYSSPSSIDFGAWVNYTPFTVDPRLPTETVLEMFKKLGPRIILIEHHGQLRGIVTRKDVLRALHQPTFVSKQDYFGPEDEQGLAVSEPTAPEPDMEMGTVTRRRP